MLYLKRRFVSYYPVVVNPNLVILYYIRFKQTMDIVLQQYDFIACLTQDYISYSFDAVKILLYTAYILYTVYDQKHSICFASLRTSIEVRVLIIIVP